MKATNSLQRNYPAHLEKSNRFSSRIGKSAGFAGCINERECRATHRAGIGLCMKTTVKRIMVLPCTFRTHGKSMHGGKRAIIGQSLDNSEARATIGTIDEGITKPTV